MPMPVSMPMPMPVFMPVSMPMPVSMRGVWISTWVHHALVGMGIGLAPGSSPHACPSHACPSSTHHQAAPQYNGCLALVVSHDDESGRYLAEVDDGTGGRKTLKLRRQNVRA